MNIPATRILFLFFFFFSSVRKRVENILTNLTPLTLWETHCLYTFVTFRNPFYHRVNSFTAEWTPGAAVHTTTPPAPAVFPWIGCYFATFGTRPIFNFLDFWIEWILTIHYLDFLNCCLKSHLWWRKPTLKEKTLLFYFIFYFFFFF